MAAFPVGECGVDANWVVLRCPQGKTCITLTQTSDLLAEIRGELSAEKTPTIQKVFPLLEKLRFQWQELRDNPRYAPIKDALEAGLANMEKWFRAAGDSPIYFIAHGIVLSLSDLFCVNVYSPGPCVQARVPEGHVGWQHLNWRTSCIHEEDCK